MRRRLVLIAAFAAVLLIPAASAQAFTAKLKASGHRPEAGKPWPIKVSATKNGKGIRASAFYQFLFQGQVVKTCAARPHARNHRKCPHGKPYQFKGSYRDILIFPKRAVGVPLTFRVVVNAKRGGTKKVSYPVRVRK